MSDENEQHENDSQADASNADETVDFEPLTATYERLRHSTDSAALSEFARRPLPDRSDQAAFSRATALLEAVAGNAHTPVEDRVFLAETMPFPNILVKLSTDEAPEVRKAVAGPRMSRPKCVPPRCATNVRLGKCVLKAPKIPPWIPTRLISWARWERRSNRTLRWCLRPWCAGPSP